MVTDFVTRLMRPKYLLKKSKRRCTLTQLANKKYDSITFSIRITFEQVWKQRLKVKKINKAAIKCNLLTGFLTTYLKISSKFVKFLFKTSNFKPVYLRSALSDCDTVFLIWKYFSSPTFCFWNFKQTEQRLRSKNKVKHCHFLAIRVCLKSYFVAVLNELQVSFSG